MPLLDKQRSLQSNYNTDKGTLEHLKATHEGLQRKVAELFQKSCNVSVPKKFEIKLHSNPDRNKAEERRIEEIKTQAKQEEKALRAKYLKEHKKAKKYLASWETSNLTCTN